MATTLATVAKTARGFSRDARKSVVAFRRSAGKTIDRARDQTGGALHRAASSVRKSSARIDHLAIGAAKGLDATASFVEDADFKRLYTGLRRFGQKHPACTLLVGAAVGFWAASAVGRMVRSS